MRILCIIDFDHNPLLDLTKLLMIRNIWYWIIYVFSKVK
ncbi:SANT domain-containing protein [Psidium guajava]|nr:SANT domain-containing protein [Psidium guajava]